jgi:hypothetical protein
MALLFLLVCIFSSNIYCLLFFWENPHWPMHTSWCTFVCVVKEFFFNKWPCILFNYQQIVKYYWLFIFLWLLLYLKHCCCFSRCLSLTVLRTLCIFFFSKTVETEFHYDCNEIAKFSGLTKTITQTQNSMYLSHVSCTDWIFFPSGNNKKKSYGWTLKKYVFLS